MQNKNKNVINFDTQLKTALSLDNKLTSLLVCHCGEAPFQAWFPIHVNLRKKGQNKTKNRANLRTPFGHTVTAAASFVRVVSFNFVPNIDVFKDGAY